MFFGTSIVFRGLDTAYLNEQSQALRCDLQFFNAAVAGMNEAEFYSMHMIRQKRLQPHYIAIQPLFFTPINNIHTDRRSLTNTVWHLEQNMLRLSAERVAFKDYQNFVSHFVPRLFNKSRGALWLASDSEFDPDNIEKQKTMLSYKRGLEAADFIALNEDPTLGEDDERHLTVYK